MSSRNLSLRLLFTIVLFLAADRASAGYALRTSRATAADGDSVQIAIDYDARGAELSALAFTIEYDPSRLRFDGKAKTADALLNIQLQTPEAFSGSTYFLADRNRIGVSLYDPTSPLSSLPSGRLATLKFEVLPGASGFAYVRFTTSPAPTAADPYGRSVNPEELSAGGVTIDSRRPSVTINPSLLSFGSVPVGPAITRRLILSNDGTAPLQVRSTSVDGDPVFTLQGRGGAQTIEAGASRIFDVTLSASASGTFNGRVNFEFDGPSRVVSIPLTANVVVPGAFTFDDRWVVPALIHQNGANNSAWRTRLMAHNSGPSAAAIRLTAVEAGGTRSATVILDLPPWATLRVEDIVERLSIHDSFGGTLLIESSTPDLAARVEIVNEEASGSSRVEALPLLAPADLFHTGETASLVGLGQDASLRTNIGLLNVSSRSCSLEITLRSAEGAVRGAREYVLAPGALLEPIDLFNRLGVSNEKDLSASIEATSSDCTFVPFATTIDSSGNLIFQTSR